MVKILIRCTMALSKAATLNIELNELSYVESSSEHEPEFLYQVVANLFQSNDMVDFSRMSKHVRQSRTKDMPFLSSRVDSKVGCTESHENNTCIAVGDRLGYKYIVLTADQQIYCKLLEMQWNSHVFENRITLRMGGLHKAMNFLHTTGKHISGSGLPEICFLALSEIKTELARFLSEESMEYDFGSPEVIVAGGYVDETHIESINKARDLTDLVANQEEADTRMVLHAVLRPSG
ncbi:hypothetical protein JTB14_005004 [Gonioctena quinquepunctata]|nr:hypothetical protein JTB14_005004 [Gonioctena quinquepunctata]